MSQQIRDIFEANGQGQVFAFFDELDPAQQQNLLADANEIDLTELEKLAQELLSAKNPQSEDYGDLLPAPYQPLPSHGGDATAWAQAVEVGEVALKNGRVAAFTVAGGQGTRLGYDGPKGTFGVTPVRQKSLFQVFAEKILAAGKRYNHPIHWFIMTSLQNHAATQTFFEEHGYFGLAAGHVHLFQQGRMPALDFDGKILLESIDHIAMSPDGHGGSFRALERSGALALMKREGIDIISYFQVDNPLVRVIDAAFIGWHVLSQSEMSSKMILKAYPEEKVGHFCHKNGQLLVVEYSDLPMELQRQTTSGGLLKFAAGSIAIHILDRDFALRMARGEQTFPFHRADKKIPTVDAEGNPVAPEQPNGIKLEMFVFDALQFARNPLVIETAREEDFSPVKNASGLDSLETCQRDQLRQFARWVRNCGQDLKVDESGLPEVTFEVSPHFGYDETSFREAWQQLAKPPKMGNGLYLE